MQGGAPSGAHNSTTGECSLDITTVQKNAQPGDSIPHHTCRDPWETVIDGLRGTWELHGCRSIFQARAWRSTVRCFRTRSSESAVAREKHENQ